MLTFEKVIDAFAPYLDAMEHEVVKAQRGYIILHWMTAQNEYDDVVERCETPEVLKEKLMGIYENLLLFQRTKGKREITEQDRLDVSPELRRMGECL